MYVGHTESGCQIACSGWLRDCEGSNGCRCVSQGLTNSFFCFVGAQELLRRASRRRQEAFRPGTRANVRSHVLLYIAFTQAFDFIDFPATVDSLLAFGEFLLSAVRAPKSVLNALGSIKHFQLDLQLSVEVFDARQLFLWRRALPLTCRHVPRQAPPMSLELLDQSCGLSLRLGTLGVVFAALMAFAFASLPRLSSLVAGTAGGLDTSRVPTFADVECREGILYLHIKWAKAQQGADCGYWVALLARAESRGCPVARWADLVRVRGSGEASGPLGKPLTIRVARAWLRVLLQRLGKGNQGFTFHSFRRGACTEAFQQGAVEGDLRALGGCDAIRSYLPVKACRQRAARALAGGAAECGGSRPPRTGGRGILFSL